MSERERRLARKNFAKLIGARQPPIPNDALKRDKHIAGCLASQIGLDQDDFQFIPCFLIDFSRAK